MLGALSLFFLVAFVCLPLSAYAGESQNGSNRPIFAVIYRSYVKPGYEEQYLKNWKIVATYFVEKRGALGSTLHRSDDGLWVAYSRWPDKATRDASWPQDKEAVNPDLPTDVQKAIVELKDCFDPDRKLPDICMEVMENVIAAPGYNASPR